MRSSASLRCSRTTLRRSGISQITLLYIVEEPERAGSSVAFLMLGNLRDHLDGCAIEQAVDEIYDDGARKVTFRDFDGNELAFGTMP